MQQNDLSQAASTPVDNQSEESVGVSIDPSMLGESDGLFDGITEEDLTIAEKIYFIGNQSVSIQIIDIRQIGKEKNGFSIDGKVLTGDHEGKMAEIAMFKPTPNNGQTPPPFKVKIWKQFLLSVWTQEEILGNTATLEGAIGRKISFIPRPQREHKGKIYQDYADFEMVNTTHTSDFDRDDIPF